MLENEIIVVIKGVTPSRKLTLKEIESALFVHFDGKFEVKELKPKVGGGFLQ